MAVPVALVLCACSGGGGGGSGTAPPPAQPRDFLTADDVGAVIARAVAEARARNLAGHIAVVDRVGNVLGVFAMQGAVPGVRITSGLGTGGGLETPMPVVPAALSAISKALTGAYLSSQGNAFSTRTASQIIQEHFNPRERQQPSGPLYGVQFSQLPCSDVNRRMEDGAVGPKVAPLGLAGDPGGLPLYKDGVLVGGVGVEVDGVYRVDREITDVDSDPEELIAVAGAAGFDAPDDIRGNRITADGRTFRYVDSEALVTSPAQAPSLSQAAGALVEVAGFTPASLRAGVAYGSAASGVRADDGAFAAAGGWVLANAAGTPRYTPRAGAGGITAAEASSLVAQGLRLAARTRAQIRRPLGSSAQVTISVVDLSGDILALARTPDGPLFGIDVAVQKARTAMFFSHPGAAAWLSAAPSARYLDASSAPAFAAYVQRTGEFLGDASPFMGLTAWSTRALGNIHRPLFPDGIEGTPAGPLSTDFARWSPFNVGLQLDLANNQLIKAVGGDFSIGCAGRIVGTAIGPVEDAGLPQLRNGIQIFPGGMPIYRGAALVGAIGVSGDGVDQDDMIAFLSVANAGRELGTGLDNAPHERRADRLAPLGSRLRYVQCPQSPFNNSTEQNVCAGL